MESFNNKLEIGMPAMIVGCYKETSRPYIGTIVIVEEFLQPGDEVTQHYQNSRKALRTVETTVRVSDYKGVSEPVQGVIGNPGVGFFDPKHLMPLPPLEDLVLDKEKELAYDH